MAERTIRNAEFQKKGLIAQRKSIVLLSNDKGALPLKSGTRLYAEGVDVALLKARGSPLSSVPRTPRWPCCASYGVAARARRAAVVVVGRALLVRPAAPVALVYPVADREVAKRCMNTGGAPIDLTIAAEQLQKIRAVMGAKPTVVAMYFDRPYVVPEIAKGKPRCWAWRTSE